MVCASPEPFTAVSSPPLPHPTLSLSLILVKELLEYVKKFPDSPVSSLKIRPLPRCVVHHGLQQDASIWVYG